MVGMVRGLSPELDASAGERLSLFALRLAAVAILLAIIVAALAVWGSVRVDSPGTYLEIWMTTLVVWIVAAPSAYCSGSDAIVCSIASFSGTGIVRSRIALCLGVAAVATIIVDTLILLKMSGF
ncbi:hypothetical protein [Herbiconiux liukaitaii]|uniref:hypothetical protein n=1 Tax=Herbiconiux liukaitaii TaxID=3342799 RepID=UPI0035BA45CB